MTSLVTANIRGDNLDQLFSTHLDSLAISPQTKRAVIPALLGIAKLTEVRTQGTPVGPDQASAAQELLGPKIGVAATAAPGGTYTSYQSHQRPFSSSSGSGYTIWYFSRSDSSIQSPPMVPQSKTGHLYVHFDASTKTHQYWMLGVGGQWEVVSRNSEYPLNHDRVLSIRSNGEPSWVTRATTNTTDTRKEKRARSVVADLRVGILIVAHPYRRTLEQFKPGSLGASAYLKRYPWEDYWCNNGLRPSRKRRVQ
ncbi:hypothetical protein EDB86DRAFT_2834158 [Lactarius hatsudake]|nr:hypothetical protein EDB86DRAFT_2834141 [Lactarius hatsudake]KAH8982999.1 hypothetical protein EDB86DRAFT_2834158 [Lactarius hatsudake]